MPKLMVKNKKVIKECVKMIKEDKNLLAQFKFCNSLRKFNCDTDAKDYINESLNLVAKDIDYKTLRESNKKFAKFLITFRYFRNSTSIHNTSPYTHLFVRNSQANFAKITQSHANELTR
jgi:hypothetical protein